jgi:hypothetical protein
MIGAKSIHRCVTCSLGGMVALQAKEEDEASQTATQEFPKVRQYHLQTCMLFPAQAYSTVLVGLGKRVPRQEKKPQGVGT